MSPIRDKIKLLAIDLDGTLLTSDRRINPRAKLAVSLASEAGIIVCLASGRAVSTMFPYADELGLRGPLVSCNGAYVLGLDREEIHHRTLPDGVKKQVMAYGRENNLHTNVYVGGDVYFSSDGEWAELYRRRTGVSELSVQDMGELDRHKPTKVLFIDSPEAILRHRERLSRLIDPSSATITLSEAEYIEFLPPIINKAEGLKAVANVLNIDSCESAAIGDYYNDLEMVEWAGFGGAVSSAVDEVRNAADIVVSSNDEGGVAEFIQAVMRLNG